MGEELIDRVLHHLSTGKNAPSFVYRSDWFCYGPLCSYERLVSLRTFLDESPEELLAWALSHDPSTPQHELSEWLSECQVSEVPIDSMVKTLRRFQPKLGEELETLNPKEFEDDLPAQPCLVPANALEGVTAIQVLLGPGLTKKQRYGPTHIRFWRQGDWFFYYEWHGES